MDCAVFLTGTAEARTKVQIHSGESVKSTRASVNHVGFGAPMEKRATFVAAAGAGAGDAAELWRFPLPCAGGKMPAPNRVL